MPCIAECGGFLYLHEQLEAQQKLGGQAAASQPQNGGQGEASQFCRMAGVIPAQAVKKGRKGHFGYIQVTLEKDCLLGLQGDSFRAHEFHYWESTMEEADCSVVKPGNGSKWREGVCTKTLYAGFPHLYFYGCPAVGEHFLQAAKEYHNQIYVN